MNPQIKKIPYGQAEFGTLRSDNCYYVDKTRFIPLLEASPRYVFFSQAPAFWQITLAFSAAILLRYQ
ncbi:MAG: hypothetical protein DRI57_07085 [Deltaproteobacteria bacterium]|nr:MAG: hypothetical protein DRI57_07085 [Deltaproteobacteria bacterium]